MALRIGRGFDRLSVIFVVGALITVPEFVSAQDLTWTGRENSDWSHAPNWDAPGVAAAFIISDVAPSASINAILAGQSGKDGKNQPTLSAASEAQVLTMTGASNPQGNILDLNGQSLTLNSFVLQAGTIRNSGSSGFVNVGSVINISGGTIENNVQIFGAKATTLSAGVIDGTISNSAVLQITGTVTGNSTFINSGTVNVGLVVPGVAPAVGSVSAANFTQNSGITMVAGQFCFEGCSGPSTLSLTGQLAINAGEFSNFGIVTAGAIANSATFENAGGGTVTAGSISNAGAFSTTGTVTANSFTNTGAVTIESGGTISGASYIQNGGSTTNFGTLSLTSQLAVNGGTFTNNSTVTAGQVSIANAATLTTTGALTSASMLNAGTVNNSGTVAVTGAYTHAAGATLNNTGEGTFTAGSLINFGTFALGNNGVSVGAVTNNVGGVVNISGTTNVPGTYTQAVGATTNNIGTLTLGSLTNSGAFNNSGTTTVTGTYTHEGGATLNNTGTFAAGSLVNFGTFALGGGVSAGTVTNNAGGVFTTSGSATLISYNQAAGGVTTNAGTLNITGILTNAGTFSNAAGATLTAGSLNNVLGGVLNNAGTIVDDLTNAGTVNNNATYTANVASNSGTINNNSGAAWTGNIQANTGTINTLGTWNANSGPINNAGTFNYLGGSVTGITTFTNSSSGTLSYTGSLALNAAGSPISFVNNGTIAARAPTDRLTINGSLSGSGTINTVVTNGNASVVTVQGTSSGDQNISVTNSGSSTPVFNSPQTVLALNGGGSLAVANTGLVPQISNGLVNTYLLQNSPGSNAYLQTAFSNGPIAGAATGLVSAVDALAIGFFQNASAIVSRPNDPQPNQIGGGPFARVLFGGTKTNLTSNGSGLAQSGSSFTDGSTTFSGFQAGFDIGVYNIDSSDWNINLGFFGGVANAGTFASTTSPDPIGGSLINKTQLSVSVPFVALYAFLSKASFSAEVNVRRDFYNGTMSSLTDGTSNFLVSPNTPLTGTGWSLSANISNRFNLKDWLYVEPLVSLYWGNYYFNNVPLNSAPGLGSGAIQFDPIEVLLGRVGANVGSTFLATDNLALAPFVHGSVWHDFARPATASAVGGAASSVNFGVTSDRVGTFGQVGAGVQFKVLDIDLLGFVRGDLLFGNSITGAGLNIGLRKQF